MAKTDMERVGLFSEMGYTTIKDPYAPQHSKPFNVSASKGHQMLIGSTKPKSAFQDGYFDKKFTRVMEGEAYTDMIQLRRRQRIKEAKKNIGGAYVPPGVTKEPEGLGSHFGTLGGKVKAFSAAIKPQPKYKTPGKNVLIGPGKKGTGYGYPKVTIGEFPKNEPDPYDRAKDFRKKAQKASISRQKAGAFKLNLHPKEFFQENPFRPDRPLPPSKHREPSKESLKPFKPSHPGKQIGGCKAGSFDPYPKHSSDQYIMLKFGRTGPIKSKMKGGVFKPSQDIKSTPTCSVIDKGVMRRMNVHNYMSLAATV